MQIGLQRRAIRRYADLEENKSVAPRDFSETSFAKIISTGRDGLQSTRCGGPIEHSEPVRG